MECLKRALGLLIQKLYGTFLVRTAMSRPAIFSVYVLIHAILGKSGFKAEQFITISHLLVVSFISFFVCVAVLYKTSMTIATKIRGRTACKSNPAFP